MPEWQIGCVGDRVFWWNGWRGHWTYPCVISFYGDCEGTGLCPCLLLLTLIDSSRELLLLWIMLLETCYSVFSKSLTTNLLCRAIGSAHIELGLRINLCSTPKLFNFIQLNWVVFKIIVFKMMVNFLGGGHQIYIYVCVCVKSFWNVSNHFEYLKIWLYGLDP